jgi:hypothetical protein
MPTRLRPAKLQLNYDFQFVRTSSTSLYLVPINPVLGLTPRLELGAIFDYQLRDGFLRTRRLRCGPQESGPHQYFGSNAYFFELVSLLAQLRLQERHDFGMRLRFQSNLAPRSRFSERRRDRI